ncbi:MAG: RNA polymerase factor sigma-54 [Halieaceae bacterium]|jgi:RNA polymerase sigma-54 factor|nr:RNA polymerase factor sigma-54 [Halieaceae bacterium]
MKQSLQLKLGQQLVMTPQLQQAIKLLQLSTLDLQQEIQEALDTNPMLEVEELAEDAGPDSSEGTDASDSAGLDGRSLNDTADGGNENAEFEPADAGADAFSDAIPDELPVDSQWDDVYTSGSTPAAGGSDADYDLDSRNSAGETLSDHLLWQLNLTRFSDKDRVIALAIIDATDDNGRLTASLEEIWEPLAEELEVELDEALAVLHRLQQFDPPGVCTHDLQECLLVQLQQLPADTPYLPEAKLVINRYINLLGNRDYAQLMRRSKIREPELRSVLALIQSLNPTPGQSVGEDRTEYVVPDVFVKKKNGSWAVELNPDIAPRLRINEGYAGLVKRADNSADNTYMRDSLQEARWFLKSLQSRNETLMKVASCIVEHQRGFLEYGEEAMKPLVLHDIAEAVEMHESTISRVTTQKYMHTPRGIFELKYFFSSHVSTAAGGECSSTAIRALIRKLIAAENPRKPLSDSKITTLLEEQGIKVARRTIAKYREALVIPPSNERKRLV